MADNIRNKVFSGLLWSFAEKMGSQGISFVVSIVLARLLMPEQYGLIAMLTIIITISNCLINCGLAVSLVQKKDADDLDFDTTLYCSTFVGCFLYCVMYVGAPFVASFFNQSDLVTLTRVYTISFLWSGYSSVLNAYISKHMLFRKMFIRTVIANISSGIIGIYLAYEGFGVWALVAQNFASSIVGVIALQISIDWHPRLQFAWSRAKQLLAFGLNVAAADLIGNFFNELRSLLIGKFYMPADLALYNKGCHLPQLVSNNIEGAFGAVLFPAMSLYGDDKERVKKMLSRSMKTTSYITFFFLAALVVISEPFVRILFTERWIDCVPYMQLMCLGKMISIVSNANLQALKAIGEGKALLKLEIYKKPVFLMMAFVGAYLGVLALAFTLPLYALYASIINMRPNKRFLEYGFKEQIVDLMPATILSLLMCILLYPINSLAINDLLKVLLGVLGCAVFYLGCSFVLKVDSLFYVINVVCDKLGLSK